MKIYTHLPPAVRLAEGAEVPSSGVEDTMQIMITVTMEVAVHGRPVNAN